MPRRLFSAQRPNNQKSRHQYNRRGFRLLRFEMVEERRLLATFNVTNLLDGPVSGPNQLPGSLRQAIFDANVTAGVADEILIDSSLAGSTITLVDGTSLFDGPLEISSRIVIRGPVVTDPQTQIVSQVAIANSFSNPAAQAFRFRQYQQNLTGSNSPQGVEGLIIEGFNTAIQVADISGPASVETQSLFIRNNVFRNNINGITIANSNLLFRIENNFLDGDATGAGVGTNSSGDGIFLNNVDVSTAYPIGVGPRIGSFAFGAGNTIINYATAIEILDSEIPSLSIDGNTFGGNTSLVNGSNGIAIRSQAPSSGGRIAQNQFLDTDGVAITLSSTTGFTIEDNTFSGNGFVTSQASDTISIGLGSSNLVIRGNTFSSNAGTAIGLAANINSSSPNNTGIKMSENKFTGLALGALPIDLNRNGVTPNDPDDSDAAVDGVNRLLNHPVIDGNGATLFGNKWVVPVTFDALEDVNYRFEYYRFDPTTRSYTVIKSQVINTGPLTGQGNAATHIIFTNGAELSAGDRLAVLAIQEGGTGQNDTSEMSGESVAVIAGPQDGYYVNSTADLPDANPADGLPVASNGYTTLRAAVMQANFDATLKKIFLGENTYPLTLTGSATDTSAINDLDITGEIQIVGAGPGRSVVDASFSTANIQTRLFEVQGTGKLSLAQLTVTGGNNNTGGGAGGAAYIQPGGFLSASYVAFTDNITEGRGGAIRNQLGMLRVYDSVFTNNKSASSAGGAISLNEAGSTLEMGRNVFADNSAPNNTPTDNFDLTTSGLVLRNDGYNLVDANSGVPANFYDSSRGDATFPALSGLSTDIYVVTSVVDSFDHNDDSVRLSLREAVHSANGAVGTGTVWAPAWRLPLTLQGSEGSGATAVMTNDLDVTDAVNVRGVGPGLTIIDLAGLSDPSMDAHDRAFELTGSLAQLGLFRVTIRGGAKTTTATAGMAALANTGTTLTIEDAAIVNNSAAANGTGVRAFSSNVTVTRSVFTNNSTTGGNGGIYATATNTQPGNLTITDSIFALNSETASDNVFAGTYVGGTSGGGNLYDGIVSSGNNFAFGVGDFGPGSAGYAPPTFVVTTVADTFANGDDAYSLSVREAIEKTNAVSGAEVIWLPAWKFVLTIDRSTHTTDTATEYGDLDIGDQLTIRGVANRSSVLWRPGVVDAVFELLGDYNGDGLANGTDDGAVNSADYSIWRDTEGSTTDRRADGNDDGVVNQLDYNVWLMHYGSGLNVWNVTT